MNSVEWAPCDRATQTGWWPFRGGGGAADSGAPPPVLQERVRGQPVPGDPITIFLREAPGSTEMCISDSGNQRREKEVFLNFSSRKINAQKRQTGKNMDLESEGLDFLLSPHLGPVNFSGPRCSHL